MIYNYPNSLKEYLRCCGPIWPTNYQKSPKHLKDLTLDIEKILASPLRLLHLSQHVFLDSLRLFKSPVGIFEEFLEHK